jgi:hypothetical protein
MAIALRATPESRTIAESCGRERLAVFGGQQREPLTFG